MPANAAASSWSSRPRSRTPRRPPRPCLTNQGGVAGRGINSGGGVSAPRSDIGDDGITPNDAGYGHQNFPVITSADDSGTVKFSLDTTADTYQIDVFRSTSCDASGNGEGETNLVGRQLVVGSTGSHTYSETGILLSAGQFVTVTATGANGSGDTSEFSNCFQVTSAGPQTLTVDRTDDVGGLACTAAANDCDLRSAIQLSNATAGARDTIAFDVPASTPIQPTTPLPDITDPVTIDGSTEPGYAGVPLVQLDGSSAGAGANGLHIVAGNSTVRALSITGFGFDGIRLETGGGNLVAGNWIGVALGGAAAGNGAYGVETRAGSANNVIGGAGADGNVISANGHTGPTYSGVGVFDAGATGNVIKGNFIGTNVAGTSTAGFGNGFAGVLLRNTGGNSVGVGGVGNVISGNANAGVYLDTEAGDTVAGNLIGTNAAGTAALANGTDGITLSGGSGTTIGGSAAGERNVISGNGNYGVAVHLTTSATTIQGNFVGTNAAGTAAVANGSAGGGGLILAGSANTKVGGTTAPERNVISGNTGDGVAVAVESSQPPSGLKLWGNYIGTNAAGTAAVANTASGVEITAGDQTVGGTGAGQGNVISGNGQFGIQTASVTNTVIQGNYIGTNAAGTGAVPNQSHGVEVGLATTVGGTASGARNVISGNGLAGVDVSSTSSTIQGNYIGTNAAGTAEVGNCWAGINVDGQNNQIGGSSAAARNVISGNGACASTQAGVELRTDATGNHIQGNYIGTNAALTAAIPNSWGVEVGRAYDDATGPHGNTIGGTNAGEGNVIAGNSANILLAGAATSGNAIQGNWIGTDPSGDSFYAGSGVVSDESSGTIGGTAAGAGNVIAHQQNGIVLIGTAHFAIRQNQIFANSEMGIDLVPSGPTPNDPPAALDADTGPNDLQNFPVLTGGGQNDSGGADVTGTLDSAASTLYTVEFFDSSSCDSSGFGEGAQYAGSTTVTTNGAGHATFSFSTTGVTVGESDVITATATDPAGNTSEFSALPAARSARSGQRQPHGHACGRRGRADRADREHRPVRPFTGQRHDQRHRARRHPARARWRSAASRWAGSRSAASASRHSS